MLLFVLKTAKLLNEAKCVLYPFVGRLQLKETNKIIKKKTQQHHRTIEQTRTMTTTDTSINNIMMPLFLQVLASNFIDKHRNALDKGRDEDRSM